MNTLNRWIDGTGNRLAIAVQLVLAVIGLAVFVWSWLFAESVRWFVFGFIIPGIVTVFVFAVLYSRIVSPRLAAIEDELRLIDAAVEKTHGELRQDICDAEVRYSISIYSLEDRVHTLANRETPTLDVQEIVSTLRKQIQHPDKGDESQKNDIVGNQQSKVQPSEQVVYFGQTIDPMVDTVMGLVLRRWTTRDVDYYDFMDLLYGGDVRLLEQIGRRVKQLLVESYGCTEEQVVALDNLERISNYLTEWYIPKFLSSIVFLTDASQGSSYVVDESF